MIRPLPCSRMCGSTARVIRDRAREQLLSIEQRAGLLIEFSSAAPAMPTPALLTRTSIRADQLEYLAHHTGRRSIVGDVERQEHHSVPLLPGGRPPARAVHGEPGVDERMRGRLVIAANLDEC